MPMSDDSPVGESVSEAPEPFQPLVDPESEPVQPKHSPSPSEPEAPGAGGTSGEDGEANPEPEPEPLPEFDEKYRERFTGLLYLGYLEERFVWLGHEFVIKTTTTEESAAIGLLCREYEGTRGQIAVYQAAVVAASVKSVDGQPLPQSLGPALDLKTAFDYISSKWHPPVREYLFNKVFLLETQAREVLRQMGNASG